MADRPPATKEDDLPTFTNALERAAWSTAEELTAKGLEATRLAQQAADFYYSGKMLSRARCEARGMSAAEADIRWSETTRAKKALSHNEWYTAQSIMYSGAATSHYLKAQYLTGAQVDEFSRNRQEAMKEGVRLAG